MSADPEFAPKAADIIGLNLNPPTNAIVLSVDEKPCMQAPERTTGYVKTSSGKIARSLKRTYKRHGTLNLFAALNVASGEIGGKITTQKKRPDFLKFMGDVVTGYPPDREIHVILDNYFSHKKNGKWLKEHLNMFFHFTSTSELIEPSRDLVWDHVAEDAPRRQLHCTLELKTVVEKYFAAYKTGAQPFVWKKDEVIGSQIKNAISNLCK